MIETAKTTSMVFIILGQPYTAAFRGFGGEEYVRLLAKLTRRLWSHS